MAERRTGYAHDTLSGGYDDDYLSGGTGHDDLYGGAGRETLNGGLGEDIFAFSRGTSGLTSSTADMISDWNRSYDSIDMTIKGHSRNYREVSTGAQSIATAASDAECLYGATNVRHVFFYNSDTDKVSLCLTSMLMDGLRLALC